MVYSICHTILPCMSPLCCAHINVPFREILDRNQMLKFVEQIIGGYSVYSYSMWSNKVKHNKFYLCLFLEHTIKMMHYSFWQMTKPQRVQECWEMYAVRNAHIYDSFNCIKMFAALCSTIPYVYQVENYHS